MPARKSPRKAAFVASILAFLLPACSSPGLSVSETPNGKKFIINPSADATVEAQAEVRGILDVTESGCVILGSDPIYVPVFPAGSRVDDDGVSLPNDARFRFGSELIWGGAYASVPDPITEQLKQIPDECLIGDLVFLNVNDTSN